jgi:phospholipase/lecithinase/hemolysin
MSRILSSGSTLSAFVAFPSRGSRTLRMALVMFVVLFAGRAAAFSGMYIFGDSLSDTGNIFINQGGAVPAAPYFAGRFSNGPVWVETLASGLGLTANPALAGGTNYAFGGAATGNPPGSSSPTLIQQMGLYLSGHGGIADPNALYVVWGGGNDVRAQNSANSVTNLSSIVSNLAAAGAVNFLVPNLPDIGLTPEAVAQGTVAIKTTLSVTHNANLVTAMDGLRSSLGINILNLDVYDFVNQIVANPGANGFTNTTDACYSGVTGLGGPGTVCATPNTYLFWDGIHPTAAAGQLLGLRALAIIPVPSALFLLGSALGALGVIRRKSAAG